MATIQRTLSVDLSAQDLANAFIAMPSGEQAAFLDEVGKRAKDAWGEYRANQQWASIAVSLIERDDLYGPEGMEFVEGLAKSVEHFKANPPQKVEWQTIMDPRTQHGDFRR